MVVWYWMIACSDPTASSAVPSPERVAPEPNGANQITIRQPRVRAVDPGISTTAAFVNLENEGEAVTIVKVKADVSGSAELHEYRPDDEGIMQMRKTSEIEVPAHGTLALEPGGPHLMLRALKGDLEVGEGVAITLTFKDDSELGFVAPVAEVPQVPAKPNASKPDSTAEASPDALAEQPTGADDQP